MPALLTTYNTNFMFIRTLGTFRLWKHLLSHSNSLAINSIATVILWRKLHSFKYLYFTTLLLYQNQNNRCNKNWNMQVRQNVCLYSSTEPRGRVLVNTVQYSEGPSFKSGRAFFVVLSSLALCVTVWYCTLSTQLHSVCSIVTNLLHYVFIVINYRSDMFRPQISAVFREPATLSRCVADVSNDVADILHSKHVLQSVSVKNKPQAEL